MPGRGAPSGGSSESMIVATSSAPREQRVERRVLGLEDPDVDAQVGPARAQVARGAGHQAGGRGGERADGHRRAAEAAGGADVVLGAAGGVQQRAARRSSSSPGGRGRDAARVALQERTPTAASSRRDVLGDRRLGVAQGGRRVAEGARAARPRGTWSAASGRASRKIMPARSRHHWT